MTNLEVALAYAGMGWRVFPIYAIAEPVEVGQCGCSKGRKCDALGKHPRLKGFLDLASTDPEQIRQWWKEWPRSGIGIATGIGSNLAVLDVDTRHGGDETLADLERLHGKLPATVEAITPGRDFDSARHPDEAGPGRHLYFRSPPGGLPSGNGIGEGVDLKCDRGFVVVPPTTHPSGRQYEWELSSHPDDVAVAELPQWVIDLRLGRKPRSSTDKIGGDRLDVGKVLAGVPEGERNETLFKYASRLRGKGLSWDEASALVMTAATRCQPPLAEAEALKCLESAWRYEAGEDRDFDAPADPSRFTLIRGSSGIEELPAPTWLVQDVLVKGSLALMYGQPGIGKSFVALDLAASIATGTAWQGRAVEQGPVLMVLAEGVGDAGLRMRAWRTAHEVEAIEGTNFLLGAVNLFAGEDQPLLDQLVDLGIRPALIVADTLARSMAGGDENSAKDMGLVVAACDRIRAAIGSAVLLIHHEGKTTNAERGSSALKGAVDTQIRMDGPSLRLRCEKQKMAAPFDDLYFSLLPVPLGDDVSSLVVGGGPVSSSLIASLTPLSDKEAACLTLVSSEALTRSEWIAAAEAIDISRATFYRCRRKLEDTGLVLTVGILEDAPYLASEEGKTALESHRLKKVSSGS